MKIASILCAISTALMCTSCAISETSADEVGEQFQEGIQGRGRIVPNDPTNDSLGPEYR